MEKINIYVPVSVHAQLDRDARSFEVFKPDGKTINRNRFLNRVLLGYYKTFYAEYVSAYNAIVNEFSPLDMPVSTKQTIANRIVNNVVFPKVPKERGQSAKRLSLKPTAKTEGLLLEIIEDLKGSDALSSYLCKMLMSYCDKPSYERERIVFFDTFDILSEACRTRQEVVFTTIWDNETVHRVVPYQIAVGQGEMYNYLLCAVNTDSGEEARTYRLNRINKPRCRESGQQIPEVILQRLIRMKSHGAQFSINDDEEACVKLTDEGAVLYSRIYFGRPDYQRIEQRQDDWLYFFNCSQDQLFLYFKRFGNGSAEVLYPEALRARIIDFHSKAFEAYTGKPR